MKNRFRFRVIGALVLLMGALGIIIGASSEKIWLSVAGLLILLIGMRIATRELRAHSKEYWLYQKRLKKGNKLNQYYLFIGLGLIFIFILAYIFASYWIALFGIILAFGFAIYLQLSIYHQTYKWGKYILDRNPSEKKKSILILIALFALSLILWYVVNFVILEGKLFE